MSAIKIEENVPLRDHTTMRLGGLARYLTHIGNRSDLVDALAFAEQNNLPIFVLGAGANTIFSDVGFSGLVVINEIKGLGVVEKDDVFYLTAGAGEVWDDVVAKSVELGLTGIEAMTMVPGTAGAAPVQNIGCYGQELADALVELEAYDLKKKDFVILGAAECEFFYRTSIFNAEHPHHQEGRYIITSITLGLRRGQIKTPLYATLQKFFDEHHIADYSPLSVRNALKEWRSSYLPDQAKVANCGSFFKNPIVSKEKLNEILNKNPDIQNHATQWYWELPDGRVKIAAGRLAEMAGLRDWHDAETGMATWKTQALLFVNENAKSYADLVRFKNKYLEKINEKFGITFEEEVRTIG
jgi:UDP-N-acetylmuramate dehydrogenase